MNANVTRSQILNLYRALLRESRKFPSYNFRMFAVRKTRDQFRENSNVADRSQIGQMYREGLTNLEVIKRQVLIGQLYTADKLVIERRNS